MNFNDFLEQCITDCIEGSGHDPRGCGCSDCIPPAREQSCNAPECCCDKCWAQLTEVQP